MKISLLLASLLAAGSAQAAFPIEQISVNAAIASADAVGPHRTTSANTIGLVNGGVVPAYIAAIRGCVLSSKTSRPFALPTGETLRLVDQGLRAETERNCMVWEESVGGDDFCSVEGKPLNALQLTGTYARTSGELVTLSCRLLNTHDAADMANLVSDSFGALLSTR